MFERSRSFALVLSVLSVLSVWSATPAAAQAGPGALLNRVIAPFSQHANSVLVDRHSRTLIVGQASIGVILVSRFTADDQLDPSFGANGHLQLTIGRNDGAFAVALDAQERIVIAGYTLQNDGFYALAIRLLDNGRLDPTFNGRGFQTIRARDGEDNLAFGLTIDGDENIILAGQTFGSGFLDQDLFGNFDAAIYCLRPDGTVNTAFGTNGVTVTDFGHDDGFNGITLDLLGRIVAVGNSGELDDNFSNIIVARYTFDGHPDSHFGDGGHFTTSLGARWSGASGLVIDHNDRIIIGGTASPGHDPIEPLEEELSQFNNGNLALMAFNDDGSRDTTFGTNGIVQTDITGRDEAGEALTIDRAGRLLLAGYSHTLVTRADMVVARYDTNGVLDPHFGTGGISTTSFIVHGQEAQNSSAGAITINPIDNRIILAGHTISNVTNEILVAYARFEVEQPDYLLSPPSGPVIDLPITSVLATPFAVFSLNGFFGPVNVTVSGSPTGGPLPAGIGVSINGVATNTIQVQVPFNGFATNFVQLTPRATARPQRFTVWLRPDPDPLQTHLGSYTVNLVAGPPGNLVSVIDQFRAAGAIDNDTVANALKSTLTAAQHALDAGDATTAAQQLSAFLVFVDLQRDLPRGRHIATSATIDGIPCNPVEILLADGRNAMLALQAGSTQKPIVGYVTNRDDSHAMAQATVTIFDASNQAVASAQSDSTGLYRITATSGLVPGATYRASVTTFPGLFNVSTPALQTFTWQSAGIALDAFELQVLR
jgi:uncharacterized delta-60 repeat protein